MGTYYGSHCGELEALIQHPTVLDSFEDISNNIYDDDDDSADNRDNGEQHVNNISESMENVEDSDNIHAQSRPPYEEPCTCMEGTKFSTKKLLKYTLEDAIGGGIEILNHLHSIMLIVAMNMHWIRVKKETNTSHP